MSSSNFNNYRRVRGSKNGGGVLYTSELIDLCSPEAIEFICIRVHNRGKSIYIHYLLVYSSLF